MNYRIIKISICLFFFCFYLSAKESDDNFTDEYKVIIIPVSGQVDPGMAAFIGRVLSSYDPDKKILYVFEMNTFGGRVDAALEIVDTITSIPAEQTIAFVKKKAISAGALIALSCGRLAMKENSTIGDCAPISFSEEGAKMLGEKFQSPLRAKFRALAKRNNYPSVLSESMVTAELTVLKLVFKDTIFYVDSTGYNNLSSIRKKKIIAITTIVKKGELLTMDHQEAKDLGFSSMSILKIEEFLEKTGIKKYSITRIRQSWSEKFVRFIGKIAPILMMIGFFGLYTEMKTPGFGVPGILGLICLALVFGAQYIVGLADHTELLLLMLGIALLGAELFVIPGFGITGITGILLIAAGMVLSLQDFVIPKPEMPWQAELLKANIIMIIISLACSTVLTYLFFQFVFPRLSGVLSGPYLSATLKDSHNTDTDTDIKISSKDTGIAVKTLRPSGKAKINNKIVDVVTDGEFIAKGENIHVVEVVGNRIIVCRSKENDE